MEATVVFNGGFKIDDEQAFIKMITHEFPKEGIGNEWVQNNVDAYEKGNMAKRIEIIVQNGEYSLEIINYGNPFSIKDFDALLTLGLSTKSGIETRGKWGVGFYASFNPELGVKKIVLRTNLEGEYPFAAYFYPAKNKRPVIKSEELKQLLPYSSSMKFYFGSNYDLDFALRSLENALKYLNDIDSTINDKVFVTIWEKVRKNGTKIFKDNGHTCFVENSQSWHNEVHLDILCKFQLVSTRFCLAEFLMGGRDVAYTLQDFETSHKYWWIRPKFPYVKGVHMVISSENLDLTVSRNSYYLNSFWVDMIAFLKTAVIDYLIENRYSLGNDTILNNIYIFRDELKVYLNKESVVNQNDTEKQFIAFLADCRIFRLFGEKNLFSLQMLKDKMSSDKKLPVYYTGNNKKLWLSGAFQNDFVLVSAYLQNHPYQRFNSFTEDVFSIIKDPKVRIINLDTVGSKKCDLKYLVENGFIDEELLNPQLNMKGFYNSNREIEFQKQFHRFLNENHAIREAFEKFFQGLRIRRLLPVFFIVDNHKNLEVSSCFINEAGLLMLPGKNDQFPVIEEDVLIGLSKNHPIISSVVKQKPTYESFVLLLMHIAHYLPENLGKLKPLQIVEFNQRQLLTELRKAVLIQKLNS